MLDTTCQHTTKDKEMRYHLSPAKLLNGSEEQIKYRKQNKECLSFVSL